MNTSRIDLYLSMSGKEYYQNTPHEQELVTKFTTLYSMAKSARDGLQECSPENLAKWRKAYEGTLNALTQDGSESRRPCRQLRKLAFEIVESLVDNSIPMPKMKPRYKTDLPLVGITEEFLKYEIDRVLTKNDNDRSERATYIDGTGWYKVGWDSLSSTHERSGDLRIDFCTVDQIVPQPGVRDYKQLEYIFEAQEVSTTRIYDLYGRLLSPISKNTNVVDIVSCYYLNEDRIVGLFTWSPTTQQVVCNEENWQIRKLRKCTTCKAVVPVGSVCPSCGGKTFRYGNAETEVLAEPLYEIYNPYEVGETDDTTKKDEYKSKEFLPAGAEVPFYLVRQLPFVPRPAISSVGTLYGISSVKTVLEMQDGVNKTLTKALDKTLKSGAVITKPAKLKFGDTDDTFKILGVKSAEEAQMVTTKQVVADTTGDIMMSNILYDNAKSSSGITDSFQGKRDTTAISGKAKEYAAVQSAGRIESMRVMKSNAFAGLYELMLKYLLAFSDEPRKFVRTLPDGTAEEQEWSKYMFLDKDKYGATYYRDDFTFDCDTASTLSQNRVQMWQETQDKFINGAFGNPAETRTLKVFWNTMDTLSYPLAKIALAAIEEGERHLPEQVEQAIMNNPQLLQLISEAMANNVDGRGGARPNSGPQGNGATHAANVERTNERNRSVDRDTPVSAQQGGGVR